MALMEKYRKAVELAGKYVGSDLSIEEVGGKLQIKGTATYEMGKNIVWDAIKAAGPDWEKEVAASLKVQDASVYGRYKVEKGDTLSKIAALTLGKAGRYTEIFEANKGILKNPDVIHPGQELTIPKK
jgi:nucleoid-associated protein YgaU